MRDTPQGSDWWRATDGKWYSPGEHPGFVPPPPPGAARRRWRAVISIALTFIAVMLVFGAFVLLTSKDPKPSTSPVVDQCRHIVRDRLKSPATASFDADARATVTETHSGSSGDELVVSGTVDSENGFGANIRSTYVCFAKPNGHNYDIDPDRVVVAS